MKIRNGFVSNSSSSSFIVNRYEPVYHKPDKSGTCKFKGHKSLLTKTQEKLLRKNGFTIQWASYPDHVRENKMVTPFEQKYDKQYNYARCVICNQDEEIRFLLSNRISFTASEHYNHRNMAYDGKTDKLIIAENLGEQMLMSGTDMMTFGQSKWDKEVLKNVIQYITGKKYLKKIKWLDI